MKRYKLALPNWILTDHYRFVFLRDGEVQARCTLAEIDGITARRADVDALSDLLQ